MGDVAAVSDLAKRIIGNVEKAIVGKRKQLVLSLVAWLSGGHILLEDVPGVAVVPALAAGTRCARSWKILPEVGSDKDYPDVSLRDAQALRERAALGL